MAAKPRRPTNKTPRTYASGGGDATASGVNFQQSLGALIASWMLTQAPMDSRLTMGAVRVRTLRMETEAPLDDVLAETSGGGYVAMQAKSKLSSSRQLASEFGKTIDQIVRQWRLCREGKGDHGWDRPLAADKDRFVIVCGPDSPATIRQHLARGLEARRQIGPTVLTKTERRALRDFDTCLRLAWGSAVTDPLTDTLVRQISQITYVVVIDPLGADRAAMTTSLRAACEDPDDATSTLTLLERVSGDLMENRGGVDLAGLRQRLITRGARLSARPDFRPDIEALRAYSLQAAELLRVHEAIESDPGNPIGIARRCQPSVDASALGGHLLLTGEPGAGKSAVINALGRRLRMSGHPVVELAVDRFSVQSLEGLTQALGLNHSLVEVLKAWDGPGHAFLLIDALDASRGGPAEGTFKRLIESVIELRGRWCVIASIRSFDLRLGQNFRTLFRGTPPDSQYCSPDFSSVRHIEVPTWNEQEFAELLERSSRLAAILHSGPDKLREIALVPFNTRLLADLIASGAVGTDFRAVDSQIALLNLYWERRIERHGTAAEVCLRKVVATMIEQRSLRAPRLSVAQDHPAMIDALTAEGVLILADQTRLVQFRHHLLFDYVASRVFLSAHDIVSGAAHLAKADGLGLLLGPAMRFLLQGLWTEESSRQRFWNAATHLLGSKDGDPVIAGVTSRTAAELAFTADDVIPLASAIAKGDPNAIRALAHVVGAVAVRLEDEKNVAQAPWVNLALELSANPAPVANLLRLLSFLLVDRVKDEALRHELGIAVRALLKYGLTLPDSRSIATPAISFVADTMATDPPASSALLSQVFDDVRFEKFAAEEAPTLARKIASIAQADPKFAADIYREVYTREVQDTRQTSMGTGRILNLTSNARQDFGMARWSLGEYFPKFLAYAPVEATQGFLAAMDGYVAREHSVPEELVAIRSTGPEGDVLLQPDWSHIWAHDINPQFAEDGDTLLSKFATFLEKGDEPAGMRAASLAKQHAHLSAVWSRIFMAAALRGGALADLAAPYAMRIDFVLNTDTRKDAIDLVSVHYERYSESERRQFEASVLEADPEGRDESGGTHRRLSQRVFGAIGRERLLSDKARAAFDYLTPYPGETNPRLYNVTVEPMTPSTNYWMDETTRADPATTRATEAIEAVKAALHLGPSDTLAPDNLDAALGVLGALRTESDAGAIPDATLNHRADGYFAQGMHKLVSSALITAETSSHIVAQLIDWIESSSVSSNPEVNDKSEANFERNQAWGAPSARMEAAEAALDLILKRPETYPRLRPTVDRALQDPHPAVRLQSASRLVRIWDLDREGFWQYANQFIATERNQAVLDGLICTVLSTVMWHGAERQVAGMVLPLLDRFQAEEPRCKALYPHLIQMVLQLWLHFDLPEAAAAVNAWFADCLDHPTEVLQTLVVLRGDYIAGMRGDSSPMTQRLRATHLLIISVAQAANDLAIYTDQGVLSDTETERARTAVKILDTACQQLFFATGAFRDPNTQADAAPTLTIDEMRAVLRDLTPTFRLIATHGGPHTIYYLIQMLEYMIDANPAGVFDLVSLAVLKGGRESGYQFESLAADLMIKLFGRYLADHKEIFNDPQRRNALLEALETFVAVGWPAARRLFYRLPDILN